MTTEYRWSVIGGSVAGVSHRRSGRPNQDAISYPQEPQLGLPLVLAVSDGHGSAVCLRSDVGAGIAVDVASRMLRQIATELGGPSHTYASRLNHLAEEKLPRLLIEKWVKYVSKHKDENPCSKSDIKQLLRNPGRSGIERLEKNWSLAYGATLLSVLVTETCILYLQLGDGDIVVVSEEGEAQRAVPRDEKLIGNETTSLCGLNAWHDMRIVVRPIEDQPPAMILVSTDGYANSFRDDAGFLKVGTDLLQMIRQNGIEYIGKELNNWLQEASDSGSGDDVTVGIVCRL